MTWGRFQAGVGIIVLIVAMLAIPSIHDTDSALLAAVAIIGGISMIIDASAR